MSAGEVILACEAAGRAVAEAACLEHPGLDVEAYARFASAEMFEAARDIVLVATFEAATL